ncbi:unnamed protein product [Haemonchus placei]|uniref:Cytochrome-b5 reductase n=1 Tax=Haemonchus placei TaxID=6290 RepID=A0A0N4VU04_HAEPC|nr:unnamed protein product [Haemonchus placei]
MLNLSVVLWKYLHSRKPPVGRSEYGRVKVALLPGKGLMDWVRLASGKILAKKRMSVDHEELVKHNKRDDCWIHIFGQVYDVTSYLEFHPGGVPELMRAAGTDATDLFNQYHAWVNYENMLKSCLVGRFTGDLSKLPQPGPPTTEQPESISEKRSISHDTLLFVLRLPEGLFFPIATGQHVSFRVRKGCRFSRISFVIYRPYTPVSCEDSEKIESQGICTPSLRALNVGDSIEISEPIGNVDLSSWVSPQYDVLMLAAGTGLTPMVNVLRARLKKMADEANQYCYFFIIILEITLNYYSMIGYQCDEHILSSPSEEWNGRRGRIDSSMLPIAQESLRVLICGPDGFNATILLRLLLDAGYKSENIHIFQG